MIELETGNMPELPEVENIVKQLRRKIKGKKISKIEVYKKSSLYSSISKFVRHTAGKRIKDIKRIAKIICIEIEEGCIAIHLKMTGRLIYVDEEEKSQYPDKYTVLCFELSDRDKLYFSDVRRFGWVKFLDTEEYKKLKEAAGYDTLEIGVDEFINILYKYPGKRIYNILTDQSIISGIGNIYANEALYLAKIHPLSRVSDTSSVKLRKLHYVLQKILKSAIKLGGTSMRDFVDIYGRKGRFEKELKGYGREGKMCIICKKSEIKRSKLSGRSIFYCPRCQEV